MLRYNTLHHHYCYTTATTTTTATSTTTTTNNDNATMFRGTWNLVNTTLLLPRPPLLLPPQVHNLADTISINHNWLSAPGLMSHVAFISRELDRARGERNERGGEPDDSEAEFEASCQRKLRAHAGTDVPSLLRMLDHFAERAIAAIERAVDEGAATAAGGTSLAVSATRARARLRARQRLPRYELRQMACRRYLLLTAHYSLLTTRSYLVFTTYYVLTKVRAASANSCAMRRAGQRRRPLKR